MPNPTAEQLATYWCWREKGTSKYICPAGGFKGRGGTFEEPREGRPRLFLSKPSAKGWLTTWLKGKVKVTEYQTYEGDYDIKWEVIPAPSRKRENMELVEFRLMEVLDAG